MIEGLPLPLLKLACDIANETGVSVNDVVLEAARDGLEAIRPQWDARKKPPKKGPERPQPS